MNDNENDEKKAESKDIEIVNGNGSELDFSPVYEHLTCIKPKPKDENEKKKEIIIPEVKKKKEE